MKKIVLSMFLMMVAITVFAQQEMLTFEVKGSEKSYNQVRVVNETSLENFHCRVVVLNADSTVKEIYGNYELEERGDSDSNTKSRKEDRIKQGNSRNHLRESFFSMWSIGTIRRLTLLSSTLWTRTEVTRTSISLLILTYVAQ